MAAPRTPPEHLVVESRPTQYPRRLRVNLVVRNRKERCTDDPGGKGHEVAREVLVCPYCARRHRET